ncbi:hypothetical protein V499_03532 [Pseudogymnoascus sp. VKM F-103]|nr:hypothetical protein V499_03532 [Pseudogymnoascus sp. VKM F-103]
MAPPAATARRSSPLRRREKSPVKQAGESAYPYEYPASRARPSAESAYPYEHPSSRARPSWRTEPEEDDGFEEEEEEEDLYGLEPSYTERSSRQASYMQRPPRQEPLDRRSLEPEGSIDLDDDPGEDIDLDTVSRLAYAFSRRSGTQRDPSMPSLRDIGRRGRAACSLLVQSKGKGKEKYEGIAQVASLESISESIATSVPRSIPVAFDYRARRADSPAPIPAPMGDEIEADHPFSDTYSAFYLTPLPPLTTTSYTPDTLPVPKRRTSHYINRPTIIPPHTTAIIIAESANTSPTTTTATNTTTTTTNPATTSTSTSATTAQTHTTTQVPPAALTPDPPEDDVDDEGFSEPTVIERLEALDREREQAFLAGLSRACGRVAARRGMGDLGMDGMGGGREGGGVVRPRVRKRISKRKGGRRDP